MDWDQLFVRSLSRPPHCRSLQDLQIIYYGLSGLEALQTLRDSALRTLCKVVRYEKHLANDVLYYTGELSTCWYILLSGSVFIDGSMFLPRSSVDDYLVDLLLKIKKVDRPHSYQRLIMAREYLLYIYNVNKILLAKKSITSA